MDKICPACIDEYAPEKEKCDRCDTRLIPINKFTIKTTWPHCKTCENPMIESADKCDECGQSFYLIPLFPKISALIMGLIGIALAGILLDRIGVSRDLMNLLTFLVGAITWVIFNKQYHVTKKEGDVVWTKISQKSRFNFRTQKRKEKK